MNKRYAKRKKATVLGDWSLEIPDETHRQEYEKITKQGELLGYSSQPEFRRRGNTIYENGFRCPLIALEKQHSDTRSSDWSFLDCLRNGTSICVNICFGYCIHYCFYTKPKGLINNECSIIVLHLVLQITGKYKGRNLKGRLRPKARQEALPHPLLAFQGKRCYIRK